MTDTELTPRARAKRDQIIAGAQRVFLEHGFAGTSTDAIAAAAGVSKQTLYVYYPSKEQLLVDVLGRLIQAGLPDWSSVAERELSVESRDELRRVLTDLAGHVIETLMQPDYIALARVIVAESARFPRLASLFRSTVPERVLTSVAALLERARERGIVEVPDVEAATRMFAGPLLTYVLLDGLLVGDGPPRRPTSAQIGAIVDLYVKAIT